MLTADNSSVKLEVSEGTCWLKMERMCTNVQSATRHLVMRIFWWITFSPTLVRSHTNVYSATNHSVKLEIWGLICWSTLVWNCTNVHNVTNHLIMPNIWKLISWHIPRWGRMNVHNANYFVLIINWKDTCWPTVEWSCTNVRNVMNHSVKLDIWGLICSFTLERSLTSANNATIQPPQPEHWDMGKNLKKLKMRSN